ncbi:hypothetical protein [Planktotalea sp.]|uniref:hypothetical protein n=1 Tax=Planktotalea sp. TaxID=2029877 RepID=UPI003299C949
MRMIGIGLLGFLFAGIALLLSTMNILERGERYVREITDGPQLVFEHRTPALAQDPHEAKILRTNPDHPVILSGLPAYQSVAFNLPVDARPTSGYLQIDATSQVLEGVEGVLRISIRNTRRAEMLLHSGEAGRSLQIPLSPEDFAGDQLVVSFSLKGTGPHTQCGPQDGVEAVVEIETTSAIYVTLDQPQQSPRDQIYSWGNVARVAWPEWLQQDEQLRRLVLATQFQRRGLTAHFAPSNLSEEGLTTNELRAAFSAMPAPEVKVLKTGQLAEEGANAGLRRFHRQVVWRDGFDLVGHSKQPMPSQLDLHLLFGRLIEGQNWTLTVTLNKRLVFHDQVDGAQTNFHALIDLPATIQAGSNALEVVATSTNAVNGICDQGPELIAEMLPQTRLIASETPFADAMSELQDTLRSVGPVNVDMTSTLSAIDADAAIQLLDHVIPVGTELKAAGAKTHVTVLGRDHKTLPLPDVGRAWFVTRDASGEGLAVTKWTTGDALPHTDLAILVTPDTSTFEEAEG